MLSSTFKTTAEVRPLSNGAKPPTSPPIWLHTVCVYYCVCALGWVKCRAQILSMGHHTCSNLTFTLNATIHCYFDFYYTSMIKRNVHSQMKIVVNYSPSCRSKYIRPSFIFRTQIKIFLMKSERFLRDSDPP